MPKDQAYLEAEKNIVNNHPRILFEYDVKFFTNARKRNVAIRLFVKNSWTVFNHPKGG